MRSKRRIMHGKRLRRSPLLNKTAESDTLETTMLDSVVREERANKTLKERGYDPNTRKKIKGKYGIHDRKVVSKIDQRMYDAPNMNQVPIPPEDYL